SPVPDLPAGSAVAAYRGSFSTRGGETPFSFPIVNGQPSDGLALSAGTGEVSGTPQTAGVALKLTDSTAPGLRTASSPLSTTVAQTGPCGYPTFNCARIDRDALVLSSSTVPPDAGAHQCAAGSLRSCGNVDGFNTIMTDPAFNNVKILRVSD